jgi:hypothetical protein
MLHKPLKYGNLALVEGRANSRGRIWYMTPKPGHSSNTHHYKQTDNFPHAPKGLFSSPGLVSP